MWSLPNPASGRACRPGPDLVLHASPEELAAESWHQRRARQRNPRGPVVTYPEPTRASWDHLYVRTAVIWPPGWRPGARGPRIRSSQKAAEVLEHIGWLDHERVVALHLDADWRLMAIHEAAVGGLSGCAVTPKDILRVPVLIGSTYMILAHNHPSGDPTPSADDIHMTKLVARGCALLGLSFVDHLVLVRERQHQSIVAYADQKEGYARDFDRTPFPATADRNARAAMTHSEILVARRFGTHAKLLVRTAMVEAPERQAVAPPQLSTPENVLRVPAVQSLAARGTDTLITICTDAALRLLAMHVTVGDVHDLGLRGVFAVAATVPTSAVILAHRHRTGSSLAEDRKRSMILKSELGLIGIGLLDHLVFVDGAVTSVN